MRTCQTHINTKGTIIINDERGITSFLEKKTALYQINKLITISTQIFFLVLMFKK